MTLINQEKTIEENTSQQSLEEEVPTLIIHSSSPPTNITSTLSSVQPLQQLSLNLKINQNYYSSSFESPTTVSSPESEELELESFKRASNQYFQHIEEEEMMNASNNIPQHYQSQDPFTKSQVEFVIQEPSVPYDCENLVSTNEGETSYEKLSYGGAGQEFQHVEYVNPNHYGQPMMGIPNQIIYDLPRETPDVIQPTIIHTQADVDIEAHHIKIDEVSRRPRNVLGWVKENRLMTIFIVIAVILFFYAAAMVIVNSVVHLIPCVLATVFPIVLVKKRLILCGFVLGALFIDVIISCVLVYHIMEEDGEWNAVKIALVFVLYVQEILTQVIGIIIVFRIYQKKVKNNHETTNISSGDN